MKSSDTESCFGMLIMLMIVLGMTFGSWVTRSYFEAQSYNNITGKNVSTWDAMWVELRVDGSGK